MATDDLFLPLQVDYYTDDNVIEAGYAAELLHIRACCFAKRRATDGKVSRKQLGIFGHGIPQPARKAAELVGVGLWAETDGGWIINGYLKHNPSREELQVRADMAKQSGELGAHKKWHLLPEGKPSPKCRLCVEEHLTKPGAEDIGPPIDPPNGVGWPETETETTTETETETETETITSTGRCRPSSYPTPHDDDDERINLALDIRAWVKSQDRDDPDGYAATVRRQDETERRPGLVDWLDKHPTADAEELCSLIGVGELDLMRARKAGKWIA